MVKGLQSCSLLILYKHMQSAKSAVMRRVCDTGTCSYGVSLCGDNCFTDMSRTSPGCVTSLMLVFLFFVLFTDISRTSPGCVTSVMLGGYFTDMSCTVLGYVISMVMLGGYNLQTYVTLSATLRDLTNVAWLYFTDRSHTVARLCDLHDFSWLFFTDMSRTV